MTSEQILLYAFLLYFCIQFVLERALVLLNVAHVKAHARQVPAPLAGALDPDTHRKSIAYTLARSAFGHVTAVEGAILKLIFLFSGLLPWLSAQALALFGNGYLGGVAFLFAFFFIAGLLGTPLDLYGTFVIEAKFGFNKTTFKTWLLDRVKGALLGVLIGAPFIAALLWLALNSGALWWLWAALFMIGFQFLMMILYPLLISPLFNKFTPLEEGELSRALKALAERCQFGARGIYVMDGSTRSSHSNAYFTGLGRARRIVLYDTLVAQLSVAELSAVLAHEIGHYKLKHIPKGLALACMATLAGFYGLSVLLNWPVLDEAFGGGVWADASDSPLGVAQGFLICSLIAGPLLFWTGPLANALSRKHEYEADAYAAEHCGAEPMSGALLKLHEKNLSNPTPHPWYSAYHYSHPAIVERLGALKKQI